MDMLSALMSPVSKEDELKALADSLRKRKQAADFYSLSTIKPLQAMGQRAGEEVVGTAERQGVLREALARRQQEQAQQAERLAAQQAENTADRDWRTGENDLDRQAMLLGAAMRASRGGGTSGGGYGTRQEREQFQGTAKMLQEFQTLKDSFSPAYGTPAPVPGVGRITNAISRLAPDLTSEERQQAANWHGLYEMNFNIPERNKMFGAALTKTEKPLWEAATITPNMDGKYIQQRLEIQERLMRRKAEQEAIRALRSGKYSVEDVAFEYANVLPNFEEIASMADDPAAYNAYRNAEAVQMMEMLGREDAAAGGDMGVKEYDGYSDEELENLTEEELQAILEQSN